MDSTIRNFESQKQKSALNYTNRIIAICAVLFALILGRAFNNFFFYLFAGVSLVVFLTSSIKLCIPLLLFIFPFAPILKLQPGTMSFFTILFFLVILKMVLANRRINAKFFLVLFLFFGYCIVFSGFSKLTTIITMVCGILLLYYLRFEKLEIDIILFPYAFGLILSSVLALFKSSLPIISVFIREAVTKIEQGVYANRFCGLLGNPNYYTLDITILMAAIIVLMYYDKTRPIHTLCFLTLAVFGIMSVSKSFLLTLLILIVLWFIISVRRGSRALTNFIFIAAIACVAIYLFAYDYINFYLLRFAKDSEGSLDSITTGRFDILITYLKTIFGNPKILFFGNGLDTMIESYHRGAHNTIIQSIYDLGIIGSLLFWISTKWSIGRLNLKGVLWIPIVALVIRMFAISLLTYDNLWFYFIVITVLTNNINMHKSAEQI